MLVRWLVAWLVHGDHAAVNIVAVPVVASALVANVLNVCVAVAASC